MLFRSSYYLALYERTSGSVGKVRDGETEGRGFESIVGLFILLLVWKHKISALLHDLPGPLHVTGIPTSRDRLVN